MQILGDGFVLKFTPHARGSTLVIALSAEVVYISPACAGINLGKAQLLSRYLNLPRMRGDQPNRKINRHNALQFTPHARGSTFHWVNMMALNLIYPACAGITLRYSAPVTAQKDLPRMCGDQPAIENCCAFQRKFTPHTRGST